MYTKYEKARILGARAFQIALNAPPNVKPKDVNPVNVAIQEFKAEKVPLEVKKK